MNIDSQTTILRPLLSDDAEIVADIFRDSVLNGTAPHYSEAERIAWAGPKPIRNAGAIGSAARSA